MVRATLKTLSFAMLHFSVGFGVAYVLTGSVAIATGIALIEPAVNTVVFFLHERAWARFERKPRPDRGRGDRSGGDRPENGGRFQEPTAAHA